MEKGVGINAFFIGILLGILHRLNKVITSLIIVFFFARCSSYSIAYAHCLRICEKKSADQGRFLVDRVCVAFRQYFTETRRAFLNCIMYVRRSFISLTYTVGSRRLSKPWKQTVKPLRTRQIMLNSGDTCVAFTNLFPHKHTSKSAWRNRWCIETSLERENLYRIPPFPYTLRGSLKGLVCCVRSSIVLSTYTAYIQDSSGMHS